MGPYVIFLNHKVNSQVDLAKSENQNEDCNVLFGGGEEGFHACAAPRESDLLLGIEPESPALTLQPHLVVSVYRNSNTLHLISQLVPHL